MVFETIYDRIFVALEAAFPDRKELINPYIITDNNNLYLKSGYGVELGPMAKSEAFNRVQRQFQRNVSISLTEKIASTDKDTLVRRSKEKELISDQLTLITTLKNNISSDWVEFVSDEGIEYIFDERDNYIRLRANFIINYNETVR